MATETPWAPLWKKARQARAAGRVSEALSCYSTLAQEPPPDVAACLDIADAHLVLGRQLKGLSALYEQHRTEFGEDRENYPVRPAALPVGSEGPIIAARVLEHAAEKFPGNAAVHLLLGQALEQIGLYEAALSHYEKALSGGESKAALMAIAAIQERLGSYRDAIQTYARAARQGAGNLEAAVRRAALFEQHGQIQEVSESLSQVWDAVNSPLTSRPQREAVVEIAWAVLNLPGPDALSDLRKALWARVQVALTEAPSQPLLHLARGLIQLAMGNGRDARRSLAEALVRLQDAEERPSDESSAMSRRVVKFAQALLSGSDWADSSESRDHSPRNLRLSAVLARGMLDCGFPETKYMPAYCLALAHLLIFAVPLTCETRPNHLLAFHRGKFLAVPQAASDFTIIRGVVVRIPAYIYEFRLRPLGRFLTICLARISRPWRRLLRYLSWISGHLVAPAISNPALARLFTRIIGSSWFVRFDWLIWQRLRPPAPRRGLLGSRPSFRKRRLSLWPDRLGGIVRLVLRGALLPYVARGVQTIPPNAR